MDNQAHDSYPPQQADIDNNDNDSSDDGDQDMSDVDNSDMDVDSNEYNDDHDDQDSATSRSSQSSRDPSAASESSPPKMTRTRTSKRAAAAAAASAISSKTSAKSKRSSAASKSKAKDSSTATSSNSKKSTKNVGVAKTLSQLRKHSSSEEESPEAKRQKFLERNRMAASKCREKKRLQTLKTIEDADVITARNQALHETLDELQEEVRTLKNLILCHRDCGCDVIQKFVQSSFKVPSVHVHAPPSQSFFKRF